MYCSFKNDYDDNNNDNIRFCSFFCDNTQCTKKAKKSGNWIYTAATVGRFIVLLYNTLMLRCSIMYEVRLMSAALWSRNKFLLESNFL